MDEFAFGPPGRRGPQLSLNPKVLMLVGALLAAALAVFGFLSFVSKGGEDIAQSQATVVQQVDHSQDAAARATLANALVAAKTAATETGTYQGMTVADLDGIEPSLTFTDGPSPNASTISVAVQGAQIGLAALSPSGTCFYVKDDIMNGPRYGSGTACTGKAALGASAPSW
jgi:hypothetical protein